MADQAPTTFELVEVKSEDILAERRALYDGFMNATTWSVSLTVGALALMWIFLV
jgi:hypothetical protein